MPIGWKITKRICCFSILHNSMTVWMMIISRFDLCIARCCCCCSWTTISHLLYSTMRGAWHPLDSWTCLEQNSNSSEGWKIYEELHWLTSESFCAAEPSQWQHVCSISLINRLPQITSCHRRNLLSTRITRLPRRYICFTWREQITKNEIPKRAEEVSWTGFINREIALIFQNLIIRNLNIKFALPPICRRTITASGQDFTLFNYPSVQ